MIPSTSEDCKGIDEDRPSRRPTENAGHRLKARPGKTRWRNASELAVRTPKGGGVGPSVLPTLPGLERGPLLEGQRGWYRGMI